MSRYQKVTSENTSPTSSNNNIGDEIYYAKFMRRVQATLIDLILFSFIILILFGHSNIISTDGLVAEQQIKLLQEKLNAKEITKEEFNGKVSFITTKVIVGTIVRSLMQVFISLFYILPFWIYKSATPGKMIMSMMIVDAETLKPMTKKQCFLRYFGYIISSIFFFFGFLAILFNKKKRGWHDKIAHTVVIHTKNLDSEEEKNKRFKRESILFILILLFVLGSKIFIK